MRLLTIPEAAEVLRVPRARIYQLAREGLLPVVHLGRQLRVDESALQDWIASGGKALPGGWKCADPSEATTKKSRRRMSK